jgi:hypothetical protein
MIIPSWPKHQQWEKRSKIKAGIDEILKLLPDEVKTELIRIGYTYPIDTVSIPTAYVRNYSDSDSDIDIDSDLDKDSDTSLPFPALVEELRKTWNEEGLPKYPLTPVNMQPDVLQSIARTLGGFENKADTLRRAIKNYAGIRASPDHDPFPKDYGFPGFLTKGIIAYVDEAGPWERFKRVTPQDKDEAYKKQVLDRVLGRA